MEYRRRARHRSSDIDQLDSGRLHLPESRRARAGIHPGAETGQDTHLKTGVGRVQRGREDTVLTMAPEGLRHGEFVLVAVQTQTSVHRPKRPIPSWRLRPNNASDYDRAMRRLFPTLLIGLAMASLASCDLQQSLAARSDIAGSNPISAPEFAGALISGASGSSSFDLQKNLGKVVVVDFWGSWCGPCRAEQPELTALAQHYAAKGVVFVGIDMRDDTSSAKAYIQDLHVPYPSLTDTNESISAAYNVASPPTTVIVDRNGHITLRLLGTTAGMSSDLDQLLG